MSTACPLHKVFKIGKKVQNFNQETKRSLLGKIRGVDKYECSINVQIVEVFDRFCSSNDPPTSSSSSFYLEVEKGLVLRSLMAAFWLRNRSSQSELWRGVKEIDPHQSCQKKKKVKNRHKTFYIFSTKSDKAPAKSLLLRSKTFILHGMINTAASRGPWWALTLKLSQEKKHFLASFSSVYSHIIFFCTISLDITELRLFISLHLPSNKNSNLTVHNQISLFFFFVLLTGALEFPLWLSALSHRGPVLCHLFQLAGNVCGCQKRLALVVWGAHSKARPIVNCIFPQSY